MLILVERGRHYVYLGGGELSLKDSKLLHSRYICLGSHAECNITLAQDAGAELRQSWVCTGAFKLSQLYSTNKLMQAAAVVELFYNVK